MKNFYKKYKIQIVLAGYLAVLGIFIYGGIFTVIKQIINKADEIQKKIIDNEVDNKNLAKVPQLMDDYKIFSAQGQNLNVILRKESEIEFIQSLENLAKETGNEISLNLIEEEGSQAKNSQAKAKSKEKNKEETIESSLPYTNYITIQLELRGEYFGLMKFLEKLENLGYYANVMALDLKKEERQAEEKASNPFIGSDTVVAPAENKSAENQKKEILKSLISLVVYIK